MVMDTSKMKVEILLGQDWQKSELGYGHAMGSGKIIYDIYGGQKYGVVEYGHGIGQGFGCANGNGAIADVSYGGGAGDGECCY
jgi:hypothetical protein